MSRREIPHPGFPLLLYENSRTWLNLSLFQMTAKKLNFQAPPQPRPHQELQGLQAPESKTRTMLTPCGRCLSVSGVRTVRSRRPHSLGQGHKELEKTPWAAKLSTDSTLEFTPAPFFAIHPRLSIATPFCHTFFKTVAGHKFQG